MKYAKMEVLGVVDLCTQGNTYQNNAALERSRQRRSAHDSITYQRTTRMGEFPLFD